MVSMLPGQIMRLRRAAYLADRAGPPPQHISLIVVASADLTEADLWA